MNLNQAYADCWIELEQVKTENIQLHVELEQAQKRVQELEERLQISPFGDDKIDELEEAVNFLRHRAEQAEGQATMMRKALIKLVRLLDADDPVTVGCHCTDTGYGPLVCPWCQAKQALAKAERRSI